MISGRLLGSALVALLGGAMVTSTLLQGALGVLSRFILDEFGISRSQFGLVFAAYSVVGGVSALYIGRFADRDSRAVMIGLFALAGVAMVGAALSPWYPLFIVLVMLGAWRSAPVTRRPIASSPN